MATNNLNDDQEAAEPESEAGPEGSVSNYKAIGQFSQTPGAGVLGENTATTGEAYGV